MHTGIRSMCVVLAAVLLSADAARAQDLVTEVVPIGYRSLEEVLPIIRPLVPAPGTVGGVYNKLVIKTTPANLRDIKSILAELDRAPANLLVSVRHRLTESIRRDLIEAFGEAGSGSLAVSTGNEGGSGGVSVIHRDGGSEAGVRGSRTRSRAEETDLQQVRVVEGREAFIQAGRSVPVEEHTVVISAAGASVHQGVTFQDASSGFFVRPRLSGDRVTLEIQPRREAFTDPQSGAVETRSAATVVSGKLGRWMRIGGVARRGRQDARSLTGASETGNAGEYSVYVKVERLP